MVKKREKMNNYAENRGKTNVVLYIFIENQLIVATWCINWYNVYAEMSEYLTKSIHEGFSI